MSKKRYTYQDDFEMLMVRHEYISKVKNPDPVWMKKFENIVNITASIMFEKLKPNFSKVGYDLDDVISITNCYMVGYMGLYSIERNEESKRKVLEAFVKRFEREPTDEEIDKKERTNMISFLRQRLQHASIVCGRKAKNITVGEDKRMAFAFTESSIPASDELILEKGKELGYRKLKKSELKDIKLAARVSRNRELVDKDGFRVVEIEILNEGITEYDYRCLFLNEKQDIYNSTPEQFGITYEKNKDLSLMKEEFENMSIEAKKSCLVQFLDTFKNNPKYKGELSTAKEMLKNL